ncbi:hypothetical protein BHE74_00002498 [Ensete ventricosum]|nr:hypothetical protein GW17_00059731 [Ensete ventricosum]RWW88619.1 hypothetical protein BHE74_00002498 [Ensete ventricosum]
MDILKRKKKKEKKKGLWRKKGGSGGRRKKEEEEYRRWEYTCEEEGTWRQQRCEAMATTAAYDMWSVGVVMLELILGSPHVFEINDRTRALLDQHLEGWSEHTKELAYK